MAIKTKSQFLTFMTIVFLVTMKEAHGCNDGKRCFSANEGRKMLAIPGHQRKGGHGHDLIAGTNNRSEVGELRTVPSGPDPLHHNGNGPKKPMTGP